MARLGVIYASRSYAGAKLECLAHAGIERVPRTHVAVETAITEAVAVERHDESGLTAGWDHADLRVARALGDAWIRELRTAVLVIPSVVARGDGNVLINPQHPDFKDIVAASQHRPSARKSAFERLILGHPRCASPRRHRTWKSEFSIHAGADRDASLYGAR